MATGTTYSASFRRDEIISAALKKVTKSRKGSYSMQQIDDAIKALNLLIRTESNRGDGGIVDHFWALTERALILTPGVQMYSPATDTLNIHAVVYRDAGGEDNHVHVIQPSQWAGLRDKAEEGDVTSVYFKQNRDLALQKFFVHPVPRTVTTGSEVLGSDGLNYTCILKHTASSVNEPVTGESYSLYWQQEGNAGIAWVSGTEYVNGELLFYTYERPLYDFTSPTDNPDMPAGWENYLIYKLAYDLSPNFRVPMEERAFLKSRVSDELRQLNPQARTQTTDTNNKAKFF